MSVVDSICAQASAAPTSTTTLSATAGSSSVTRFILTLSSSTIGPISTTGKSAVSPTTLESIPRSSTSATSGSVFTGTGNNPTGPNPSVPAPAKPSSAASSPASSGLSPSAKVGIGLGVPLGIIVGMALGFSVFRYVRHKQSSRLQHHGNIAAAGLYPAVDEGADAAESGGGIKEANCAEGERGEEKGPHEMNGEEVSAFTRELPGSPGPGRSELNARRGSV